MEKREISPFFIGSEFLNYCVRAGYIEFELREDKRLVYTLTPEGARELTERFGFDFDKPCAGHA